MARRGPVAWSAALLVIGSLLVGCVDDRAQEERLYAQSLELQRAADAVTASLAFPGADYVATVLEGEEPNGPLLESVNSRFRFSGGIPLDFELTVSASDAPNIVALRLQVRDASGHYRIPVEFEEGGTLSLEAAVDDCCVPGGCCSTPVVQGVRGPFVFFWMAEDSEGRVGRPVAVPVRLSSSFNDRAPRGAEWIRTLSGHEGGTAALTFPSEASDERLVSGGYDGVLRLWDTKSGHVLRMLPGHTRPVTAVALSQDGQRIVSAGRDHTVRVWDIEAPKEPLLATYGDHLDRVQAVDISPDDMMIASGSWDGTVRVRSLSDGTLIQQLDAGGPVSALSFANSIPRLTVATGRLFQEGGIRVWKTNTWELVVNNKLEHAVTALTFSTDGTVIATAIGRGVVVLIRPGQTPFLQRLDPPLELPKLAGITYPVPPRDTITAMSFLPSNSNLLAVVTLNGIISVWNVEDEMIIRNFSIEQPVLDLAFMADASQVAFGDLSGAIRVLATPPGLGTQ